MGDMMKPARQNFADHVTDKLTVARRQNEQVYHDPVPPVETLELTAGQIYWQKKILREFCSSFHVCVILIHGG